MERQAFQADRTLIHTLIERTPIAYIIMDDQYRIHYVNDSFLKLRRLEASAGASSMRRSSQYQIYAVLERKSPCPSMIDGQGFFYRINSSISSIRLSKSFNASSTGFFVDISTPASFKIDTGSFEHPALRKFSLYAFTAGAPSLNIF